MNKHYLGDGLYVDHDGFQFTLSTDRAGFEHFVCLDGDVLAALFRFAEEVLHVKITVTEMEEGL